MYYCPESSGVLTDAQERYPISLWDLQEYLSKGLSTWVNYNIIQILAKRLTLLLNKLHATGYIHRDFKADNVLVKETGEMALVDFGSMGLIGKKSGNEFGTRGFRPPWLDSKGRMETNKPGLDMWSLGSTLLCLAGKVSVLSLPGVAEI